MLVAVGAVWTLRRREWALFALIPLVGLLGFILLDWLGGYWFAPRQILMFTPYLLTLVSVVVTRSSTVAVVTVIVSAAVLLQPIRLSYQYQPNIREAARYLAVHSEPGDAIVVPYPDHLQWYAPDLEATLIVPSVQEFQASVEPAAEYRRVGWRHGWRLARSAHELGRRKRGATHSGTRFASPVPDRFGRDYQLNWSLIGSASQVGVETISGIDQLNR